jgi:hypothetical protein
LLIGLFVLDGRFCLNGNGEKLEADVITGPAWVLDGRPLVAARAAARAVP